MRKLGEDRPEKQDGLRVGQVRRHTGEERSAHLLRFRQLRVARPNRAYAHPQQVGATDDLQHRQDLRERLNQRTQTRQRCDDPHRVAQHDAERAQDAIPSILRANPDDLKQVRTWADDCREPDSKQCDHHFSICRIVMFRRPSSSADVPFFAPSTPCLARRAGPPNTRASPDIRRISCPSMRNTQS